MHKLWEILFQTRNDIDFEVLTEVEFEGLPCPIYLFGR